MRRGLLRLLNIIIIIIWENERYFGGVFQNMKILLNDISLTLKLEG